MIIMEEGETGAHRLRVDVRSIAALDPVLSAHFRVDLTKDWACACVVSWIALLLAWFVAMAGRTASGTGNPISKVHAFQ